MLKSWKLDLGDHSLFLNRVAPPIFPAAPLPAPEEPGPVLTPGQRPALEKREAKKSATLLLQATVDDRQLSELNWSDEHGSYRAFSNIDFNYLPALGGIETPEFSHLLMIVVRNDTRTGRAQDDRAPGNESSKNDVRPAIPPAAANFNPARSEYVVVEDETHPSPPIQDLAALDALHVYFDANKQGLAEDYAKREAARIGQEKRTKEPSPRPKDTIINYWIGEGATRTLGKPNRRNQP